MVFFFLNFSVSLFSFLWKCWSLWEITALCDVSYARQASRNWPQRPEGNPGWDLGPSELHSPSQARAPWAPWGKILDGNSLPARPEEQRPIWSFLIQREREPLVLKGPGPRQGFILLSTRARGECLLPLQRGSGSRLRWQERCCPSEQFLLQLTGCSRGCGCGGLGSRWMASFHVLSCLAEEGFWKGCWMN